MTNQVRYAITLKYELISGKLPDGAEVIKNAKERLAKYPEIKIVNEFKNMFSLYAQSPKDFFEKYFQVKVITKNYTVHDPGKGSYKDSDLALNGQPTIPKDLEDLISGIIFQCKGYAGNVTFSD